KKIELLAPAGSMACLKAAVSKGADSVYLGMKRFSARGFAANFTGNFLKEAARICRSNGVKLYLAMNTLVKNDELDGFFRQLSFAYSAGIDSVIIQEISFLDIIKRSYPGLDVHISTQAGVMNTAHAGLLEKADRITLARELRKDEISSIRKKFSKELEIFCHGALCASVSGQCLFSSFLGGRSGNRGRCAQPCRKRYNGRYLISAKELCLIEKIPDIISTGIDAVKIEGRMRSPYYVASATAAYRKAIDSFYRGKFVVPKKELDDLKGSFSRQFTQGSFSNSRGIFNMETASGIKEQHKKEFYRVNSGRPVISRKDVKLRLPQVAKREVTGPQLSVRAYSKKDAYEACSNGADIVYFDIFDPSFESLKESLNCRLFGAAPRLLMDRGIDDMISAVDEKKPDGILAGNPGLLSSRLNLPLHLDYSINCFNDLDLSYLLGLGAVPVISPELSIKSLARFINKDFIALVHGKLRLMELRHKLEEGIIKDGQGGSFKISRAYGGVEVINGKELGLLGKSSQLRDKGIRNFFIDTEKGVGNITALYRDILDGRKIDDSRIRDNYTLGWAYRGVS
ncbi:U32 family peptidase, partial [Candidatus Woesearchaeota archaeon]|nr:U32 family peptidase [Candidatus Woesearchaeota archaeon]